jgi:hypothetical protein
MAGLSGGADASSEIDFRERCHGEIDCAIEILARVAAQVGEPDRTIAALQKLLSISYEGPLASGLPLTPALLPLDPMFDPLRNYPRFQKLIISSGPKPSDK